MAAASLSGASSRLKIALAANIAQPSRSPQRIKTGTSVMLASTGQQYVAAGRIVPIAMIATASAHKTPQNAKSRLERFIRTFSRAAGHT